MTEQTTEAISNIPPVPPAVADDIRHLDLPGKLTMLDPSDIDLSGVNPRRYPVKAAELDELAKDIVRRGQIQPVLVKFDKSTSKYPIIAGASRTRAIALANEKGLTNGSGHMKVAAMVVEMSALEAFAAGVAENAKRNDMTAVDYAHIINTFETEYQMKRSEIAKAMGQKPSWITEHAAILGLRASIQKKISDGTISYTAVRDLSSMGEEEQDEYISGIEKGETRDNARAKAKAKKRKKAQTAGGGETNQKNPMTMKEVRTMLENMGGIGKDAEEAAAKGKEYECKYSTRAQNVAMALIKALDGKIGEKALASKIDAA